MHGFSAGADEQGCEAVCAVALVAAGALLDELEYGLVGVDIPKGQVFAGGVGWVWVWGGGLFIGAAVAVCFLAGEVDKACVVG